MGTINIAHVSTREAMLSADAEKDKRAARGGNASGRRGHRLLVAARGAGERVL